MSGSKVEVMLHTYASSLPRITKRATHRCIEKTVSLTFYFASPSRVKVSEAELMQ
jgi:hypothetical protein